MPTFLPKPMPLLRFAGAITGAALIYASVLRPWHLTWGASDVETRFPFPGDDLLPHPRLKVTHAITINAPAGKVWPRLIQMGQGRAGFYSYAWLESLGIVQHASEVRAERRNLQIGDVVSLVPGGITLSVAILDQESYLVLLSDTRFGNALCNRASFTAVWGWHLRKIDANTTRLIERWSADWDDSLLNFLFVHIFIEPGAFLFERKSLLGIKERAEENM